MAIVDILGFCISVFGVVIYLRFLLPCNIIPVISTMLTDAEQSLALALTIGASSELSNYRVDLAMFARQLALIRIESHHSPRLAPQIWLAVRRAYRLYSLASQIAVIRREVQVRSTTIGVFPITEKGITDGDGPFLAWHSTNSVYRYISPIPSPSPTDYY
ncbi:hypothetical protein EDB87DRAFT_1632437 [Lactarius vividus]|nr:hypothetical protein EDB87DRAFT_1632437 [Lactarius vividus]